jgi:hypothetical protein
MFSLIRHFPAFNSINLPASIFTFPPSIPASVHPSIHPSASGIPSHPVGVGCLSGAAGGDTEGPQAHPCPGIERPYLCAGRGAERGQELSCARHFLWYTGGTTLCCVVLFYPPFCTLCVTFYGVMYFLY